MTLSIEVNSDRAICYKCGTAYGRHKGNFAVSYAILHKGVGYIPCCKTCIDKMYNDYLGQCNNIRDAVRQVCRKLDLYWSDAVFDMVSRKASTRSMMTQYIAKINSITYAGKGYDDTLAEEGMLWNFKKIVDIPEPKETEETQPEEEKIEEVPEELVQFWGTGYTPSMYSELEQKRQYYISKYFGGSDVTMGTEVLIRSVCILEMTMAKDAAAGKPVDKSANSLNTVLGSLNLKPVQNKQDEIDSDLQNTPMGVWLYKFENKRPLPEIDSDLQDCNKIRKYIFTWMGHVCKMLGKKNGYSQLYEDEVAKYRVERPEYDGEDDETFMTDIMTEEASDDDQS